MKSRKFTIEELSKSPTLRLEFYKKLLDVVCKDPSTKFGYCYYICEKLLHRTHYEFYIMEHLPELAAYKTPYEERYTGYPFHWFPCTKAGWQKRINILVKIINKMEKSAKK